MCIPSLQCQKNTLFMIYANIVICELVLLLKIRFSTSSLIYNIHPSNEISFRD